MNAEERAREIVQAAYNDYHGDAPQVWRGLLVDTFVRHIAAALQEAEPVPSASNASDAGAEHWTLAEAMLDWARCTSCPPFCSQTANGPHVDYCASHLVQRFERDVERERQQRGSPPIDALDRCVDNQAYQLRRVARPAIDASPESAGMLDTDT